MNKNVLYILVILIIAFFFVRKSPDVYVIKPGSLVIDVRTAQEYQQGHLTNAVNIPYDEIKGKIAGYAKDKKETIVLYCRSGRRSGIALQTLKSQGYVNAVNAGAYSVLKKQE